MQRGCLFQKPLPNNPVSRLCHFLRNSVLHLQKNTWSSTTVWFPSSSCLKMGFLPALLHLESLRRLTSSWLKPQNSANLRFLLSGILLGFSFSLTAVSFVLYYQEKRQREIMSRFKLRPINPRSNDIAQGITGLIGREQFIRGVPQLTRCLRKHAIDED